MALPSPLLYFPIFHNNISLFQSKPLANVQSFGLGLNPESKDIWTCPNYPLDAKQSTDYLNEIQYMNDEAALGVPIHNIMAYQNPKKQMMDIQEQEDLKAFVENKQKTSINFSLQEMKAAQQTLLWFFKQEQNYEEVGNIIEQYTENKKFLLEDLVTEDDTALIDIADTENILSNVLTLPKWKMVLDTASYFLPEQFTALINSAEMCKDILELTDFNPLSTESIQALGLKNASGYEQVVSIAQLLEEKNLQAKPQLAKKINCIILETWE